MQVEEAIREKLVSLQSMARARALPVDCIRLSTSTAEWRAPDQLFTIAVCMLPGSKGTEPDFSGRTIDDVVAKVMEWIEDYPTTSAVAAVLGIPEEFASCT